MTSPIERVELLERLREASRAVAELEARRQAAKSEALAETAADLARLSAGNAALERTLAALAAERGRNTARAEQLRAVGIAPGFIRAVTVAGWTLGLAATGTLALQQSHLAGAASLAALVAASLPVWRR